MNILQLSLATLIFTLTVPLTSIGQTYEYHPKSSLTLGYGIDIKDLSDGKAISPFKQPFKKEFENPSGTPSTNFYQSVILTEEDLMKSYNLDANISARYLTFNASASFKIDRREILSSSNLTILISGENNYGNQYMVVTKDDLTNDASRLIEAKKFDKFINDFGNFIVNKVERKSCINVYLTLKNVDKEFKETISKDAKAGGSLGKFSGDGSISLNQAINTASKNRSFTINIQSNGDETGFNNLRNLLDVALASADPIAVITKTLKDYFTEFTRDNSPISKYYLSSVTSLGIPKEFIKWNATTEDQLKQLYKLYTILDQKRDALEAIQTDKTFISLASNIEKKSLSNELKNINKTMTSLLTIKDNCLTKCQVSPSISECCNTNSIADLETPVGDNYTKLLNKLTTYKEQTVFLDKGQEYVLFDQMIPNLKQKKLKVFAKFYFVPFQKGTIFEPDWRQWILMPMQLEFLVNGKVYSIRPQLEKGERYLPQAPAPFPILDSRSNIIGYNNYWVYNLDDIQTENDDLKVSIRFIDFTPNPSSSPIPFDQVKIHPNLFFHCEVKD